MPGLRGGVDKPLTLDYTVRQDSRVLGTGGEALECDVGETSWGDGATIFLKSAEPGEPVFLRLQATVTPR